MEESNFNKIKSTYIYYFDILLVSDTFSINDEYFFAYIALYCNKMSQAQFVEMYRFVPKHYVFPSSCKSSINVNLNGFDVQ